MLSFSLVEERTNIPTTFVVLAGGKASRMQSMTKTQRQKIIDKAHIDKARLRIEGKSLVERTLETMRDNPFSACAINSNADPATFHDIARKFQLEIFPDSAKQKHLGPLAGVLAALRWSETKKATWMLTVPCDCPFLPKDLWQKLQQRQKNTGAEIVCSESHGRKHPVVALWSVALRSSLEAALEKGVRKIDRWTEQHLTESQVWHQSPDPFFNINRPEDLEQAEALVRSMEKDKERDKA